MKHYIQFDTEDSTWALFRLFEGSRFKITNLSEEDIDTIYYECRLLKRNKIAGQKILEGLISQEDSMLEYISAHFSETEMGKKFVSEALERITYLRTLLLNSKGEYKNDGNRIDVINNEGRDIYKDSGEEEGAGGSADGLYP